MKNWLKWLLILVPTVLVFKNLFLPGILWGGDAPFFFPQAQNQLFSKLNIFTERGIAFGGINQLAWLWPLMVIFGALGKFFGIGSDLALRILFLFPSLTLSALGPYFLTRHLKLGKITQFFSILVYLLNTYYILLIDGGQVGVALAYGLFPFTLLFLLKLMETANKRNYINAFLTSALLCLADPRIFSIAFLTVVIWSLLIKKFSVRLLFLIPFIVLINLYWLSPLIKSGSLEIASGINNLNLISIINPLLLFSPHWPQNVFGKISYPAFYFAFIPLLIFGSVLFKKSKEVINIILLFLIFTFLAKGSNFPLGFFYDFVVNNIPLGSAFRDSSKFFIPVMLFGGILIGETIESIQQKYKSKFSLIVSYLFILFLISPAILGKLNFLLSNHKVDGSFNAIYENLRADPSEFRTLWFPEKHPLSYETNEIPTINARDLANFRPFAAMNASEDVFNFLNNPSYVNWLGVLGIKYLFLSGDSRNLTPNESEVKIWSEVQKLIGQTLNLEKESWGTSFDVYKIPNIFPRSFNVEKLIGVVGPDLPITQPAVYLEDGKWDPRILDGKDPNSFKILLNGGSDIDLTMSFLQKNFKGTNEGKENNWANYSSDQYLKYKYELLIRGFRFNDFDFGRGVAFSTNKGEKIKFLFGVPTDGKYILAVRKANLEKQKLTWEITEREFKKGDTEYEIVNDLGFEVVNIIALIPSSDFENARSKSQEFLARFGVVDGSGIKDLEVSPAGFWKITTTNYNPSINALPVYSMVNGIYLK